MVTGQDDNQKQPVAAATHFDQVDHIAWPAEICMLLCVVSTAVGTEPAHRAAR